MKKLIKRTLRILGLMLLADKLRFEWMKIKNCRVNRSFKKSYPQVVLPPDYLMYESFQLDYSRYYLNGKKSAIWMLDLIKPFKNFSNADVLDWGCGPGRLIRHLPDLIPEGHSFTGTDYNEKSIEWCTKNLSGIKFDKNELMPPLNYETDSFDLAYGISIFTHLSEAAHTNWLQELHRILRPGGVLFLTLHGVAFLEKLEKSEQETFRNDQLVVRGQVKEGHRTFIAFHPPEFVKRWSSDFTLLNHIPGGLENGQAAQDVWIFQKV